MARLSLTSNWLIQVHDSPEGDVVVLFHEYTQEEIVRFDPATPSLATRAQKVIYATDKLTDEEKAFAHFWSGYFYAHATGL